MRQNSPTLGRALRPTVRGAALPAGLPRNDAQLTRGLTVRAPARGGSAARRRLRPQASPHQADHRHFLSACVARLSPAVACRNGTAAGRRAGARRGRRGRGAWNRVGAPSGCFGSAQRAPRDGADGAGRARWWGERRWPAGYGRGEHLEDGCRARARAGRRELLSLVIIGMDLFVAKSLTTATSFFRYLGNRKVQRRLAGDVPQACGEDLERLLSLEETRTHSEPLRSTPSAASDAGGPPRSAASTCPFAHGTVYTNPFPGSVPGCPGAGRLFRDNCAQTEYSLIAQHVDRACVTWLGIALPCLAAW